MTVAGRATRSLEELPLYAPTRQVLREVILERLRADANLNPPVGYHADRTDWGYALADAWAELGDVLWFYLERIANECYLGTATEPRSVAELAALVGYEPNRGVGAAGFVAIEVSNAAGAPDVVRLSAGTQVQSAVSQGGGPQIFETGFALDASRVWNELHPAQAAHPKSEQPVGATATSITVAGYPGVVPGNGVLIAGTNAAGEPARRFHLVDAVKRHRNTETTTLHWSGAHARLTIHRPKVTVLRRLGNLFGFDAATWSTASDKLKEQYGTPRAGLYALDLTHPQGAKEHPGWRPAGLGGMRVTSLLATDGWIFAATDGEGVYRAAAAHAGHGGSDEEFQWTAANDGLISKSITCLAATRSGAILAGTADGQVFRSVDGGMHWDSWRGRRMKNGTGQLPSAVVRTLLTVGSKTYAGTDQGLYVTTDGQLWEPYGARFSPRRKGSNNRNRALRELDGPNAPPSTPMGGGGSGGHGGAASGIDFKYSLETHTDRPLQSYAECLSQAGIDFVCRYYNVNDAAKNLTKAEAAALAAVGIPVVAAWENGNPTDASYFSHEAGNTDGEEAWRYASGTIGQPRDTPIYFCVDYDASPGDIEDRITPYFRAVRAAFDASARAGGPKAPRYQVGVYGSGAVCAALLAAELVEYTWLAKSTAFDGYESFSTSDRWNIRQHSSSHDVCGLSVDRDEAQTQAHGGFASPTSSGESSPTTETGARSASRTPTPLVWALAGSAQSGVFVGEQHGLHQIKHRRKRARLTRVPPRGHFGAVWSLGAWGPRHEPSVVASTSKGLAELVGGHLQPLTFERGAHPPAGTGRFEIIGAPPDGRADRHRVYVAGAAGIWELSRTAPGEPWASRQLPDRISRVCTSDDRLTGVSALGFVGSTMIAASAAPGYVHYDASSARADSGQAGPLQPTSAASGDRSATPSTWPCYQIRPPGADADTPFIDIASSTVQTAAGDNLVLCRPATGPVAASVTLRVKGTEVVQRNDYGKSAKVTRVHLEGSWDQLDGFELDDSVVFARTVGPSDPVPHLELAPMAGEGASASAPRSTQRPGRRPPSPVGASRDMSTGVANSSDALDHTRLSSAEPTATGATDPIPDLAEMPSVVAGRTMVLGGEASELPRGRLLSVAGRRSRVRLRDAGGTWLSHHGGALEPHREGLIDWNVTALAVDHAADGSTRLLAGTAAGGLWVFGASQGWERVAAAPRSITALASLSPGYVLVGGRRGTVHRGALDPPPNGDQAGWSTTPLPGDHGDLTDVSVVGSARFAAFEDGSVFVLHPRSQSWRAASHGLPHGQRVSALAVDSGHRLWAATARGVYRWSAATRRWESIGVDLGNPIVLSLAFDTDGTPLAGTDGDGVFRLGSHGSWEQLGGGPGNEHVTSLAVTADRIVHAGTRGTGVFRARLANPAWEALATGVSNLINVITPFGRGIAVGAGAATMLTDGWGALRPAGPDRIFSHRSQGVAQDLHRGVIDPALSDAFAANDVPLTKHAQVDGSSADGRRALVADGNARYMLLSIDDETYVYRLPESFIAGSMPHAAEGAGDLAWHFVDASGRDVETNANPHDVVILPSDRHDDIVAEVAETLSARAAPYPHSTVELRHPLRGIYDAATVTVCGNVVAATQGETVAFDAIGIGDPTVANQRFEVHRGPITHVPAATAVGSASTLEIRVGAVTPTVGSDRSADSAGGVRDNGVAWRPVDTLFGQGPASDVYVVRPAHDPGRKVAGATEVVFGDGVNGSRLPRGATVAARYRVGTGGSPLPAGSLSVLRQGPAGIAKVRNPAATTPGRPADTWHDARRLSRESVSGLGRIVSLDDFASFALEFPGVSRADARLLHPHRRDFVHLIVAGDAGQPFAEDDPRLTQLRQAIRKQVWEPIRHHVESYRVRWFQLGVAVVTDADESDAVLAGVRAALLGHFSAAQAAIGREVRADDAIEVVMSVGGVSGATLSAFAETGSLATVVERISAREPRWDPVGRTVSAAEIAALDPHHLHVRAGVPS